MKVHRTIPIVLVLAYLLAPAVALAQDPLVRHARAGTLGSPDSLRGRALFVEYESSEDLTLALREAFVQRGFVVTEERAKANVAVRVRPVYLGPAARRPALDAAAGRPSLLSRIQWTKVLIGVVGLYTGASQLAVLSGAARLEALLGSGSLASGAQLVAEGAEPLWTSSGASPGKDAYLTELAVSGKGLATTRLQILTESTADQVPVALLVRENFRQMLVQLD